MKGRRPWPQNLEERTSWGGRIGFEDVSARSVGCFEGLGSNEANGVREKELHTDLNTGLQRLTGRHTLTLTRLWTQSTKSLRKSFLRRCDSHSPTLKISITRIGHDRQAWAWLAAPSSLSTYTSRTVCVYRTPRLFSTRLNC